MDQHPKQRYPIQAPPLRRALHLLVAIAGWALFLYWWWLVFGRVSRMEVRTTVIFIVVTTIAVVAATSLWSLHNRQIYRRGDRRAGNPAVPEDYSKDTLGRSVSLGAGLTQLRNSRSVQVKVDSGTKSYVGSGGPAQRPTDPGRVVQKVPTAVIRA